MRILTLILDMIKKVVRSFPLFKKAKPQANLLQPILNNQGSYIFFCPGCQTNHLVCTIPKKGTYHVLSGSLAEPTIRASVLVAGNKKEGIPRCHAYITKGMIEYLQDSTHELANKTVPLQPIY